MRCSLYHHIYRRSGRSGRRDTTEEKCQCKWGPCCEQPQENDQTGPNGSKDRDGQGPAAVLPEFLQREPLTQEKTDHDQSDLCDQVKAV